MEDGLVPSTPSSFNGGCSQVLILVVMEDGLVHNVEVDDFDTKSGLNPCCNGRWSRTMLSVCLTA